MFEFFKTLRAANEIVAGQRVIGVAVISYTLMHVFFSASRISPSAHQWAETRLVIHPSTLL
jgi:hypothetical protein